MVLRAPINVRPLFGIARHESAIGRGYMAWGYVVMCRNGASKDVRNEAIACLDWLLANPSRSHADLCWGDPYDYATRSGRRGRGEPLLIWSSLIGLAFLDAFEVLRDERYLRAARSVGAWISNLPVEQTSEGLCLSYLACRQSSIHNSNAMGAAFLARLGSLTGDDRTLSLARDAMTYTCARQRDDGAWFYAEEPKYHWIDNFHTGYNLTALKLYRQAAGDRSFDEQLTKGTHYFRRAFFEADGRPKYFHDRAQPADIQCAAQAIESLTGLADFEPDCFPEALAVARWTVDNMQASDGHFCYRDLGWMKVSTPMLHWGQGTMVKALAVALERLGAAHE
jgi:hypothetical protein